jgi:RNA polymerase sigma factor (sigma-70 family)
VKGHIGDEMDRRIPMETQLIREITAGDKGSFGKLYEMYADAALRTAIGATGDRELAKDAVQETFIRVYRNLESFDTARPFKPWFYRILINECNRLLNNKPRVVSLNRLWDEEGYQIAVSERENYIDLYDAILSLKDIYRIPVILKYLHGFTERETADILGLNQNTVKTRLLKARDMLRKKLGTDEGRVVYGYKGYGQEDKTGTGRGNRG